MAGYAKVSSKGQITLSAEVRKCLNIEPGSSIYALLRMKKGYTLLR